jgi:hypothetical protein
MELNELTKAKVKYFFENKIKVHISRTNGFFHNGLILEYVEDYIILDDKRNGAIPIYFIEIREIEKMEERE